MRERMRSTVASPAARGALLVLTGLALTAIIFTGAIHRLLGGDETVRAVFANTSQLVSGSSVRVDGVEHGTVDSIEVDPGGRSATVEMSVSDEVVPLYSDASAHIRYRTALGGSLAVNLDRGTEGVGELGAEPIPASQTTNQVELDEIVSVIGGPERAGMRTMMDELAKALRDPDAPAVALDELAGAGPGLTRGLRAIRGESEGDLRDLVSETARTVAALDRPHDVRDFIEGGARTVAVTARRQEEIRSTIALAAGALPDVTLASRELDATLGHADRLLADLEGPAGDVAPALAKLRPTVTELDALLDDARPLVRSLRPAARSLAGAAAEGLPLLNEVAPSLRRIDRRILPDLAIRSPVTGRSTYEMIGPAVAGLQGSFAGFDDVANFVRFPASGGERAIQTTPCRTMFAQQVDIDGTPRDLINCQTLVEALENYLSWQPLPEGGTP